MFELEDLGWFPRTIRDLATDYLQFIETRFALHKPILLPLRQMLGETGIAQVVDLCSGAAGPVPALYESLIAEGIPASFTLTDKYPNLSAFRRICSLHPAGIHYIEESVDAASAPRDMTGIRTIFNAFHHFTPEQARSVLACAVEAGQPIGIFEFPERSLATIIPLLFTPLFVGLATPFIRPFRWRRLLWTYLLPLVPLTCLWDGVISQCRAYTAAEMLELTRGLDGYRWTSDRAGIARTAGHLTYLIGIPGGIPGISGAR